jgi:excisionase family DNA binding protein
VTRTPSPELICVKVNDAARMIGVGRTKLYELIASGEIEAIELVRRQRESE